MNYQQACEAAQQRSLRNDYQGCSVHVCAVLHRVSSPAAEPTIAYYTLSDWHDGTTVATYCNGQRQDD